VIEKTVLGGAGHVDVSLESADQKIACEISVTTQPEYETEKFQTCLAAGYEAVIAIALQKDRLVGMAKAIRAKLPAEDVGRIHLCLPSHVNALLKRLARHAARSASSAPRSGGYKVKRKYAEQPADAGAQAAEEEFLRAIGRALRGE